MTTEEFVTKFCAFCGTKRCEGVKSEWFDGCEHKKELDNTNSVNGLDKHE